MECRFTYSSAEMRRAVASYRKMSWHKTACWTFLMWAFFLLMAAWTVPVPPVPAAPGSNPWLNNLQENYGLLFVPLIFTLFFWTPAWGLITAWMFRRSPLYNQPVVYHLDETGVNLESAILTPKTTWAGIGKAREGKKGFILYSGKSNRSFHWLPKNGFAYTQDIDDLRALLHRQLSDFKPLA